VSDPSPHAPDGSNGTSPVAAVPHRSRSWIWFFAFLTVLAVAWLSGLFFFYRQQQLKPQELADAQTRWQEHGPRDYDLEYTQKGVNPSEFQIQVRQGKVVSAKRNGQPLEPRLYPFYDMEALFSYIETFLEQDSQPGRPRTYTIGSFDPEDGHLLHYVRRVMGSLEQVDITVQLRRV
jgi:hypothetical protein